MTVSSTLWFLTQIQENKRRWQFPPLHDFSLRHRRTREDEIPPLHDFSLRYRRTREDDSFLHSMISHSDTGEQEKMTASSTPWFLTQTQENKRRWQFPPLYDFSLRYRRTREDDSFLHSMISHSDTGEQEKMTVSSTPWFLTQTQENKRRWQFPPLHDFSLRHRRTWQFPPLYDFSLRYRRIREDDSFLHSMISHSDTGEQGKMTVSSTLWFLTPITCKNLIWIKNWEMRFFCNENRNMGGAITV
jgi:hypothetical protein